MRYNEKLQLSVSGENIRKTVLRFGCVKKRSLFTILNKSVTDVKAKRKLCGKVIAERQLKNNLQDT